MSVKRVEEIDWPFSISVGVTGAIAASVLLFVVYAVLGIFGSVLDAALGTGILSLDIVGPILSIIWIAAFGTFAKLLFARQIPSEVAGDGLMISAKLAILAIPLILVAMFSSDFPVSVTSVVAWILPVFLIAAFTGGLGVYFGRRARKQLERQ